MRIQTLFKFAAHSCRGASSLSLGLVLITCVLFSRAHASTDEFRKQIGYLNYAAQFDGKKNDKLAQFSNPLRGHQNFRLSERNAPWAGNYFPMIEGGLARDLYLNDGTKENRELSPIEKFDLVIGNKDFAATEFELKNRGPYRNLRPESWEGFCNGVRCAGGILNEPLYTVEMKTADGQSVFFKPSDLKALAGAAYFYVEKYAQLGSPSINGTAEAQPNAAVFDLALRYVVGHQKKSFIIDSSLGPEIWNESVVGYQRKLVGPLALSFAEQNQFPGASQKVLVDLTLETLGEIDIDKINGRTKDRVASGEFLEKITTHYVLYLDGAGELVDGVWKNPPGKKRGVDFAWFAGGKGVDSQYKNQGGNPHLDFSIIEKLFKKARKSSCSKALN